MHHRLLHTKSTISLTHPSRSRTPLSEPQPSSHLNNKPNLTPLSDLRTPTHTSTRPGCQRPARPTAGVERPPQATPPLPSTRSPHGSASSCYGSSYPRPTTATEYQSSMRSSPSSRVKAAAPLHPSSSRRSPLAAFRSLKANSASSRRSSRSAASCHPSSSLRSPSPSDGAARLGEHLVSDVRDAIVSDHVVTESDLDELVGCDGRGDSVDNVGPSALADLGDFLT